MNVIREANISLLINSGSRLQVIPADHYYWLHLLLANKKNVFFFRMKLRQACSRFPRPFRMRGWSQKKKNHRQIVGVFYYSVITGVRCSFAGSVIRVNRNRTIFAENWSSIRFRRQLKPTTFLYTSKLLLRWLTAGYVTFSVALRTPFARTCFVLSCCLPVSPHVAVWS